MPLAFRLIYLYLPLYAISHITVAVSVTLISSASISISYAPGALISHLLTEIPKHMEDTDLSFFNDLLPWSEKLPKEIKKTNKRS